MTNTVDDYIERFPVETQKILQKLRAISKKVIPNMEEKISYGVPTMTYNGKYVVYFAAYKNHIGVYPVLTKSTKELEKYRTGKGTYQFPLDKPIPYDIFEKVVKKLLSAHVF